ncbi:hypothetical protein P3G55_15690 [Leptospira sp. 96542]|nr:hypothetical protein [Leptospira sp. 96542]
MKMQTLVKNYIWLFALLIGFANCATMSQNVNTRLDVYAPEGSSIYLNDEKIGESYALKKVGYPDIKNPKKMDVRVELNGHRPESITLASSANPMIYGNFIFLLFAPVGFAVDYFSGAFNKYDPLDFKPAMKPDASFKENKSSQAYIQFAKERETDAEKESMVTFGNLDPSEFKLYAVDASGNPIIPTGFFSSALIGGQVRVKPLKPGKYWVSGKYQFSKGRTIYTARVAGEQVITIPAGGMAAVCGMMNEKTKTTAFRVIHVPEKNLNEFTGIVPVLNHAGEFGSKCGGLYTVNEASEHQN